MTRKDYRLIGDALAKHNASPSVMNAVIDIFQKDNIKFNKSIFMKFIYSIGWTEFSYLQDQKYI